MTGRFAALALILMAMGGPAAAQTGTNATQDSSPAPQIDATRLPVSVARIQKKLAEIPPTATDRLRLEYYIEVYGKAPPVAFFENFDVKAGPVPDSPPTHQDLLDIVTPEGFRTPAPNISAFIEWLRRKAAQ